MRNPLSIEAFADWVEKQPADRGYHYSDIHSCACAQYGDSLGIDWVAPFATCAIGSFWSDANGHAYCEPHTFGALAQRLRGA